MPIDSRIMVDAAALTHLQIPENKKKAIRALSEAHMRRTSGEKFEDFIVGEGQGLNVLLQYGD